MTIPPIQTYDEIIGGGKYLMGLRVVVEHQSIESAPENTRVLIFGKMPAGHDEMAMAWLDRMDRRWYFAPQGGLVPFIPEVWCAVPEPCKDD